MLGFGTLPPDVTEGTLATTTVTLVDDDRAALRVSFGADAYTATENGTAATVTVTLDQDSDRDLTISIGVTGGTAATTDYGVSPTSVSFAAGDRTKTLTVTATDDADLADETVVLGFGSLPPDVTEGTPATTTVTLVDDDQAGLTVSFEASAYSTIEGAATGVTVRVSLNKAPAEEQTISIEVTGGTAATTDYGVSPTSVSFAAGDRTKTLTVTATDDALAEVNETVVLGFGTLPPDVTEGTLATTTVTLVDDDRAALRVSFGADAYTATENGTAATVTVTLDQDSDRDLTISIGVTGGTAATTDYGVSPTSVSFAAGDRTKTLTVTATDDADLADETVVLGFGSLPPDVTEGTPATTTVTLVDDDQAGLTVSFEASAYSTIEGAATGVTVRVSLNKAPAEEQTISIEVTGGTAATTDYSVSPTSVSFAAGDRTKTLTVTATDDALAEVNETVVLGFGTLPPDVTEGTLATTTVTLVDDDRAALRVSFGADAYTATENGTAATVTVTLDQDSDRALTISIGVTGGTAATTDYGVSPTSVSFAAGDRTKTLTVTATDDADLADETVVLGFGSLPPDVTEGTPATTTVTLVDDDQAGLTVSFEASAYSTIEGAATGVTVRVSLNKAPAEEQTISIEVTGGTAATTDYGVSPTSVSFAAGDRTKTLTVTATDDALAEVNETVVLGFGALPPDVTEGTLATTTVTLVDDDRAALRVSFGADAYTATENGTAATVTVTLDQDSDRALTISIGVTGGTAATTDYGVSPTSVSFAAGDRTKTLTVTATDDADLADETVVLGFGSLPPDVTEGTPATTTVTLVDDDQAGLTVSFEASAYSTIEGAATGVTVRVSLNKAPAEEQTISIEVTGGTAATTDYGVSPTSVSFAAGDRTKTLTVTATDDALAEVNETVVLGFGALPPDVTEGTLATTTVTLVDDDRAALRVSFGADAYTATENGTAATVTVTLDQDSDRALTISIGVTGGTAATTDYGVSPTSVSFAAGDRTKTLTVTATDDADLADETVVLGFGALPPDVTEGTPATTTVTLVDDDQAGLTVSFEASAYSTIEGAATGVTVRVSLNKAPAEEQTISIEVTGGTAATTDYSVSPTSVSFAAGDRTKTLTVTATDDALAEVNETVVLGFGTLPPDVTEGTLATTTVTLVDDDRAALRVSFGADAYTATEGEADGVTVTVSLDQAANRPLTIPLKTDPASGDFTLSVTEVGFTVGEQSQTFTVTATDDADLDDETVMLRFGDLTRSAVTEGKPAEAMLTIIDDEGAVVRARFRRLNNEILSKQALTLADVTIAAVTSRMDAGACAGQPNTVSLGGSSTLAEILRANAQTLTTGRLNLKQLLGTSAFRLRLTEDGSGAGPGCLTLWGQGDYRNLSSGGAQALDWDGDLLTGQVGADALLRPDLRAGLAVSWSDGAFDYTDRTTGMPISGDYSSRMVSVHPYVTWWSPMGLDLWATGGYGRGEIEIEDEEVGTHTSDTTLRLASVGASGPLPIGDALIAGGTTTLRLKAQVSLAQMEVEGNGSLLEEQTIAAQRLRLALEGSHERTLASGGSLTPSFEVGLRHDGGAGATGTGLELGGGLRYVDPALGLTIEGRGRVLAAYDDAYEEWGASGLIRLDPGAAGQGLSLSLVPSYGQTASGVQRLWEQGLPQGPTQGPSATQALTGRLEAEVGYGLTAFAGQGLVTPYGQLSLGGGTQQYRVGSRLELGPALRLSLEGTRQVTTVGQADQGIRLQADWRF